MSTVSSPRQITQTTNTASIFGSIMILIGTSIGAGMLALPLSSAEANLPLATGVLLLAWLAMTITGLLILEVNFAFAAHKNHFHSMAHATLGRGGQIISWICCIGLFYSVISAYISGNASLLIQALQQISGTTLPIWSSAVLFTAVIALIIARGMRGVDLINRGLMSVKGLLLITMLAALMPHIRLQHLLSASALPFTQHLKAIAFGAPVFLFGFGYHAVIPSLVNYVGPDKNKMRLIVLCGTGVSLLIYILWLSVSFGIIPAAGPHSFATLSAHGKHLPEFLQDLRTLVHKPVVNFAVSSFADIAMTTSCLGVSLGLFDFLADGLQAGPKSPKRNLALALTFIPPLLVTLFFPHFFLVGLSIGALFVIVLEILLPVAMVWKFRASRTLQSNYTVRGGKSLLIITGLLGVVFLMCALAEKLNSF